MSHRGIYIRLRAVLAGVAFCILLVYALVGLYFPIAYRSMRGDSDKIATVILFAALFLTSVPCIISVIMGWKISNLVKADRSFSSETAQLLSKISSCAFIDAGYFLLINVGMVVFQIHNFSTVVIGLVIDVLALAFGMAFAALARFVQKAADLQEESDLTV